MTTSTFPPVGPPELLRLPSGDWAVPVVQALRAGALVALADVGVLELSGAGAVACLQGLLTNDIEKPGDGAFVYGALLTPKGMMMVDGWAGRTGTTVRYTVPTAGRDRALAIFAHSIPPRLARYADRTSDLRVFRLAGAHSKAIAEVARLPVPAMPGHVVAVSEDPGSGEVARASEGAPFALQIVAPPAESVRIAARLVGAGAVACEPPALELARVLAGWPGLVTEVDEHTLPQEIRLDAIGGISYTKGCYTGQETVSRLHFRGHTNRRLVGLELDSEPGPGAPLPLSLDDREVGRVSTVAWLPESGSLVAPTGRWIGLGIVRRELETGDRVRCGAVEARIVELPFTLSRWEPA